MKTTKAAWKDYKYGSWLVLVFGAVGANVIALGKNPADVANHFGVTLYPGSPFELLPGSGPDGADPTLETAKKAAELALSLVLAKAILAWPVGAPPLMVPHA